MLFAGLYWSADPTAGTSGPAPPPAPRRTPTRFKFRTPASRRPPGTASPRRQVFTHSGINAYQGFKDVTPLVSGAGNGVYTVANIQAGTARTGTPAGRW